MIKRYKNIKTQRRNRIRAKLHGTAQRPRLTVFRSNKHIAAQIINDDKGVTLAQASDIKLTKTKKQTKTDIASLVGEQIAKIAIKNKIKKVTFDRGHYRFHGRIKALAQAARNQGLEF